MIAERRALEASVRDLQEERDLRERFVAALSHDLRTPLVTARMSAELLMEIAHDPQELQKTAKRIVNSMNRADAMIRDLLDASRIKAGEPLPLEVEPLELSEVTRATLDDLASIHRHRLVLVPSPEIRGYWDRSAVRRILENLVTNGVKYGTAGTPITVRIDATGQEVGIHVHNEGPPIPADDHPVLFELFKRASSANTTAKSGWGIVAGLARAHHGEVSVRSTAEEGTTFSVHLPLDARPGR